MHTPRFATVVSAIALALGAAVGCAKEDSSPAADTPSAKMHMAPARPESSQQLQTAQQPQTAQQAPGEDGPGTGQGSPMMDSMRASCPMLVSNATVEVSDTENGVTLTFTTDGDVADLRGRVQHLAQMYQMHRGHGSMMWHPMRGSGAGQGRGHMMGQGQGHMMGQGQGHMMGQGVMAGSGPMPAAKASVQNLDKGAQLELTPLDPEDLASLRNHVRMHQERMNTGECWMLQPQQSEPHASTRGATP